MKAMSWQATLLTMATLFATLAVSAAEDEKNADDERTQAGIEKRLDEARRRLDDAARDVAELSMSMSERSVPAFQHFIRAGHNRAMLGINLGARGEELSEGVAIASVSPGGAAERAGLKAGDVLIAIEDKALKRDGDLSPRALLMKQMVEAKPGDKVKLRYRRDNKVANATVIAEAPMDRMFAMTMPVRGQIGAISSVPMPPLAMMRAVGVFGSAELVPITPKLGQYFGTDKGLLVVRAPADTRLKLEDGDVIVDIGGRTPSSPTHAFRILGSYQPGEQLKLNVLRQKKHMLFEITVPDDPSAAMGPTRPAEPFLFQDHRIRGPGVDGRGEIMLSPAPAMPLIPAVPLPPPGESGRRLITIEDEPA